MTKQWAELQIFFGVSPSWKIPPGVKQGGIGKISSRLFGKIRNTYGTSVHRLVSHYFEVYHSDRQLLRAKLCGVIELWKPNTEKRASRGYMGRGIYIVNFHSGRRKYSVLITEKSTAYSILCLFPVHMR